MTKAMEVIKNRAEPGLRRAHRRLRDAGARAHLLVSELDDQEWRSCSQARST